MTPRTSSPRAHRPRAAAALAVRPVRRTDLPSVIEIDATVTGLEKRTYWESLYRRYGRDDSPGRQFLVAVVERRVVGFIIGEVRDWEFGSPPCGWVFAIDVAPGARLGGVGARMLQGICEGFRAAGVRTVRTMLARDNRLILSFFRSQGMTAGPFLPLQMSLDDYDAGVAAGSAGVAGRKLKRGDGT